jgi:threonine/homoserine/homoserine lactone efflux protein
MAAEAPALAALSLGVALAAAPGPVQAVLLTEAVRGGLPRGFRALAGAAATFGVLLVSLALGLSVASPSGLILRIMKVAGGAFLLWLAVDGFRSAGDIDESAAGRRQLPPAARGSLAVLLNPGAWLFLGAVASPLFLEAASVGGRWSAVLAAGALMVGLALGDGAVVLIGGIGVRRSRANVGLWVRRALAILLAGLGVWLIVSGVIS